MSVPWFDGPCEARTGRCANVIFTNVKMEFRRRFEAGGTESASPTCPAPRRGEISSGRAALLVVMARISFLEFAAEHGVATMNYETDDFARELADISLIGP